MSLINDALKRAKQAQQKHPPPAVPGAPLRPAEAAARRAPASGAIWLVLGALFLGVAAVVLFLVLFRDGQGKATTIVATSPAPAITPATNPGSSPLATTVQNPVATAPKGPPVKAPNAQPVIVAPITAAPVPAPAVAAETTLPATNVVAPVVIVAPALPKLQGILFRSDRPSALLNGKTVLVGGRSGEFLVVAITQESVTLVRAGVTNIVSLVQ